MSATPAPAEVAGLPARSIAADILVGVLRRRRPLDEQLDGARAHPGLVGLSTRDRALVRALVATVLRRLGTLRALLGRHLRRGFPADAPIVEAALLVGAAQILWLDVPDHAAVDLSVRLAQGDRRGARYAGLVNAVLRNIGRARGGDDERQDDGAADTPDWLLARWIRAYGESTAHAIAAANRREPPLDLSVAHPAEADLWAERLGGRLLPGGTTVRVAAHGPVTQLAGYAEGAWWVQDAAAALPARLLGDVRGRHVADLCAAPGGKTAQLAAAGAIVTAVDLSAARLARVQENLARLRLSAEIVVADAAHWDADPFDAVLLDAPCSATGTIRRHPDIPWLKSEADIVKLAEVQRRLLAHAIPLVKVGGTLVYCTCSLEPEEGERVVEEALARDPRVVRHPVTPDELDGRAELLDARGDLRSLPSHMPEPEPRMAGMDGFFAARLRRV